MKEQSSLEEQILGATQHNYFLRRIAENIGESDVEEPPRTNYFAGVNADGSTDTSTTPTYFAHSAEGLFPVTIDEHTQQFVAGKHYLPPRTKVCLLVAGELQEALSVYR